MGNCFSSPESQQKVESLPLFVDARADGWRLLAASQQREGCCAYAHSLVM
jgi:hypothetical protein